MTETMKQSQSDLHLEIRAKLPSFGVLTKTKMTTSMSRNRTRRNVLILIAINSLLSSSSSSLFGFNSKYCIVGCGGMRIVQAAENGRQQKRKQYEQERPRRNRSNDSSRSSSSSSSRSNNRRNSSSGGNQNQQRSSSQSNGNQPNDYYNILDVKKSAKLKDIKKAYRKLALKYHVSHYSCSQLLATSCTLHIYALHLFSLTNKTSQPCFTPPSSAR